MKMNRTNTAGRILVLLLTALLVLSLAACGKKGNDDMTKPDAEPKNAQEAAAMYKALLDQENAILMENQSLWEKVFMSADKGMTMQEDGKNYGDFLLDTIESAKDKFTADELKLLRQGGEKIREIERTLTAIEAKFPEAAPKAPGNGDSIPADSPTTPATVTRSQKFPPLRQGPQRQPRGGGRRLGHPGGTLPARGLCPAGGPGPAAGGRLPGPGGEVPPQTLPPPPGEYFRPGLWLHPRPGGLPGLAHPGRPGRLPALRGRVRGLRRPLHRRRGREYLSTAHTQEDIRRTLAVADRFGRDGTGGNLT